MDEQESAEKLYGDKEASLASGVPVASLRVLQAAGVIQALKVPKPHGGYRRAWEQVDAVTASMAAALCKHFGWNIRLVAHVMGNLPQGVLTFLAGQSNFWTDQDKHLSGNAVMLRASAHDNHLQLVDRKVLYVEAPAHSSLGILTQGPLLLGVLLEGRFVPVPRPFSTARGRSRLKQHPKGELYLPLMRAAENGELIRENCRGKIDVNVSIEGRAAIYRLQGKEAHFVEEILTRAQTGSRK